MCEQHPPTGWEALVAEESRLAGDEVKEDMGWDDDEIRFAISHISCIPKQAQGQTGHDAGIAPHASINGNGICTCFP
jgi:hypothetical protein